MPLGLLHGLAKIWGFLLSVIPNRACNTTKTNLQLCFPSKSEAEIREMTKRSLQHTACTALEMGKSWIYPIEKTRAMIVEEEGLDELKQTLASNTGVILLAPHIGNWEVFGLTATANIASNFLYKPPKIAAVDRLLKETRSRAGLKMAPANRNGVSQLLKALKAGELVGILPDQVPDEDGGEYVEFYGQTALTMALASRLSQRVDAKVYCGFAKRLPGAKGFKLIIKPAHPSVYSEDLNESVQGINLSVQDCVDDAVDQYQWEYKRFRRQPAGEDLYKI